jgi:phosphatidylserine decarboxylase
MTIHREGTPTLILSFISLSILGALVHVFIPKIELPVILLLLGFWLFLVSFFRKPKRAIEKSNNKSLKSPCDGKIVVIEKVFEPEYLKAEVMQVSIFMSPLNVHVNYFPTDAHVEYARLHEGKYLAAWNPKASTENERSTICYNIEGQKILLRQVAGALARRIVMYAEEGKSYKQGDEMGFIKFGSRVDIYLPLHANICVNLDDVVTGAVSEIARFE